jgi:hypothetical protein
VKPLPVKPYLLTPWIFYNQSTDSDIWERSEVCSIYYPRHIVHNKKILRERRSRRYKCGQLGGQRVVYRMEGEEIEFKKVSELIKHYSKHGIKNK